MDNDLFVLKPEWVTEIVYHIINRSLELHWSGKLNTERLQTLFDRSKHPEAPTVEPDKLPAILRLLEKFEMVYDIGSGDYRAPMLLDNDAAADDFTAESRLSFTVNMPALLPPALFYRFVTQCGKAREIDGDKLWRGGCVLVRGEVRVRVEYHINERRISLRVYGDEQPAGQYLSALRLRLFELCGKFEGLEYEAKVSGRGFDSLPYASLLGSFQNDIPAMVDGKGRTVQVPEAIQQLFGAPPTYEVVLRELLLLHIENRELRGENRGLARSLERPITVNVDNHNEVNVSQTQSTHLNLQIITQLQKIDSALDPLQFEVRRGGDQEKLLGEIEYLREKIAEYQACQDEPKRNGIMSNIKLYAGKVQAGVEGIKALSDLAATLRTAFDSLSSLMS